MKNREQELSGTTLKVYLLLLSSNRPLGPREIMKELGLSSPSVAYYHLKKLVDLGLVKKEANGYTIARKIRIEGAIIIGTKAIPRLLLYSSFLAGFAIIELVVLIIRILEQQPLSPEFLMLIAITIICATIFGIEGLFMYRKLYEKEK